MQNKLEFADGATWNYTWYRYYGTHQSSAFTVTKHWPSNQPLRVYRSSSILMSGFDDNGHAKYTFQNIQLALTDGWSGTVNPSLSTTKPLDGYYWFFSTRNDLSGDYTWEYDNDYGSYAGMGYDGETTFSGSSSGDVRIVTAANPPVDTPFYDVTYDRTNVYSTNPNAYPNDGRSGVYWYILHALPDNWIFEDKDIIGGVDYTYNINTDVNIKIGQSACAKIEFYTQVIDKSFQGRTCTYYVKQDNDSSFRKIGVFYIAKAERINSYGKYKMTGYDNVYRLNTIIDDWLYHTSYDANRYKAWDSGLSKSSLGYVVHFNPSDDTHYFSLLILCTDLVLHYNASATTAGAMWTWENKSNVSSVLQIPAIEPSASDKESINAWLNAAKGKVIYVLDEWNSSTGIVDVLSYVYYTGSTTLTWSTSEASGRTYYNVSCRFSSAAESYAPYYARTNNTYYTELDDVLTYNEAGQQDYPEAGTMFVGNQCNMYYRDFHRDAIVVNGRSTPTLIISSICGELGLSYSFSSSMGPTYIYFGFTASGITATAMLSYLAEVCGGYLAADVDGNITIKTLGSISSSSATLNNTKYKSYTYQDEAVNLIIPKVIIKQDESDSNGVSSTSGSNSKVYYITKNPWTLNTTAANIEAIANFVYNKFKAIYGNASTNTYTPMKIDCLQDWKIIPGQVVTVNGVNTYIFSKRMNASGVSFESTGDNNEEIVTVAQIESANNLNGKDIILTSYDYNNNASASLTIKGNDGSIYITTSGTGHVYVNGNILV